MWGGFGLYSERPAYQETFVSKYLSNSSVVEFAGGNGTIFNRLGRGYPDVSALAHKFYIEINGQVSSVDGTSAASPTIAGIIGLMNAHRLKNGKKVLGFINPLLYKIWTHTNGRAFNDITVGNNACTEQGCSCKTGYMATEGWDAATGLGTPNYGLLLEALDELDEIREKNLKTHSSNKHNILMYMMEMREIKFEVRLIKYCVRLKVNCLSKL